MTDREIRELARKRVIAKKNVFIHFCFYAIITFGLFLINFFLIDTHQPWFLFPAATWGFIVVIHALIVFGRINIGSRSSWEKREMEKEIDRLNRLRDSEMKTFGGSHNFDDSLELKDFEPLRKDWDDEELV